MTILTHRAAFVLFQELLAVPSPSGREHRLAAIIQHRLEAAGYRPELDAAGNLLVRLAGSRSGPKIIFAAHMDEIGFTITHIHEDGSLSAIRSGGLLPWKAGEGPVEIMTDDDRLVPGILSFGSTHAAGASDRQTIDWRDARIITGRTPQELAAAGLFPGASGTLARHVCQPILLGEGEDPLVGAWTFDDRMGCVMLLLLLEDLAHKEVQPLCPTIIAFTTREEVGGYGARFLAQHAQPDVFIAVDGAPLTPDVTFQLDGRPAAWAQDSLGPYDHRLLLALKKAAERAGTGIQIGAYGTNASDASMAQRSGAVGRAACIGHPRANSHGFEIVRASTFDHIRRLLFEFITTWSGDETAGVNA